MANVRLTVAPRDVGASDWQTFSLSEILAIVAVMDHGAVTADAESIRVAAQNIANAAALFRRISSEIAARMSGESVEQAQKSALALAAFVESGADRAARLHGAMSDFGSVLSATQSAVGDSPSGEEAGEAVRQLMATTYSGPLIAGNSALPTDSFWEDDRKAAQWVKRDLPEAATTASPAPDSVAGTDHGTAGGSAAAAAVGGGAGSAPTAAPQQGAVPMDQSAHPAEPTLGGASRGVGPDVAHHPSTDAGDRSAAGLAPMPAAQPASAAEATRSMSSPTPIGAVRPSAPPMAATGGLLNMPGGSGAPPRMGPTPSGSGRAVSPAPGAALSRTNPLGEVVGRRPVTSTLTAGGTGPTSGATTSTGARGGPMGTTGGAGRSGQRREHRSADYLRGTDNASEVIGTLPLVVPPVIGEITPPASGDDKR